MRIMVDTNILLSAALFPSTQMDKLIRKVAVQGQKQGKGVLVGVPRH